MATKQTKPQVEKETVEVVSKTELFYNKYKKIIWGALAIILIAGLGILGYSKFIYGPQCQEAYAAMYQAENAFQQGNFDVALNGAGNDLGFAQVIEEYGAKAGKSVYLYAGVCALQLDQYEDAINYLQKYSGKDPIMAARALACIGDAQVGLEDYSAAAASYEKAVKVNDNILAAAYLFKAGFAYEALGDKASALKCYKQIKDKYQGSVEAYDIDRYISAVEE